MQDWLPAKTISVSVCGVYTTGDKWFVFNTVAASRSSSRVSMSRALMKEGSEEIR